MLMLSSVTSATQKLQNTLQEIQNIWAYLKHQQLPCTTGVKTKKKTKNPKQTNKSPTNQNKTTLGKPIEGFFICWVFKF